MQESIQINRYVIHFLTCCFPVVYSLHFGAENRVQQYFKGLIYSDYFVLDTVINHSSECKIDTPVIYIHTDEIGFIIGVPVKISLHGDAEG